MPDSSFVIPPPFVPGLQALAEFSDQQAEATIEALRETSPSLASSALADRIVRHVPDLDGSRARQIVDALVSLVAAKKRIWLHVSVERVAADVAASESLGLAAERRESFARRLAALLQIETLGLASKAQDLRTEHPHVFSGARLFTDIRPVFGDDVNQPPAGAVILETLKIEYITEAFEQGAFFVSLDHDDLRGLRATIDRALDKTKSLKRFLASSDVAYWEYEDVSDTGEAED